MKTAKIFNPTFTKSLKNLALVAGLSVETILTGGALSSVQAATNYSFTTVNSPSPTNTMLLGINNVGGLSGSTLTQGFTMSLSNTNAFTPVNVPGSTSTQVVGINNPGTIVGFSVDAAGNTDGFYQKQGGPITTLNNSAASTVFNQLLGINDNGDIVGYFAPTQAGNVGQVADEYNGTSFTSLNLSNVNGGIVPFNSQATGINNNGLIVGFYQPDAATSFGFTYENGMATELDPFGSTFTQALGVNSLGEIVGFYTDGAGVQHGYVDVNGQFQSIDPTGSLSTTINGINTQGQLVGFFTSANDSVNGFVASPSAVPEPSNILGALAFLAIGASVKGKLSKKNKGT